MPPIRRNTRLNTPQRRPKIAGTSGRPGTDESPVSSSTPVDSTLVEAPEVETVAAARAAVAEQSPAAEARPAVATDTVAHTGAEGASAEPEAPGGRGGRLGWRLVAVLGAAAVVAAAFAAVAAFRPGAQVSNTAYVDIATTSEVTEATRAALTTLYAYAPDFVDQYPDRARGVLTENMRAEFDKTVDPTVSAVKQSGTSTTVELSDVGVKVLDGDRAELIVNMTVSAEANGVAQDSASGPLIVQMEKVDGVWLLSDIADQ
ncbi:mammalian cell entry protein [Prescottella agglutinans]|uniref:Mammalian cell entry protein n=1 Tax=Prescottella agglutinans TaxID=1644129 RepID=A0A438BGV9_9NOCA|nr:mammalian cell entry protein [Prescottella agglutinans]